MQGLLFKLHYYSLANLYKKSGPKNYMAANFLINKRLAFVSKIDELSIFLYINNVSFAGYCLDCRDRVNSRGGGVCLYVSNTIYNKRLLWDFENTDYECMWIWLRPNRPPRPLSSITVCVVYKAPDRDVHEQRDLNE